MPEIIHAISIYLIGMIANVFLKEKNLTAKRTDFFILA
ncbi:hypothetical protein Cycma_3689 [Cyclobacterium marinum DSM 745]|uniref:Uncharacterized protein n=1 Tax=Cyclobacterium marinum (strain ATCC 25205 / DSM 745 / LMG 13164 / NCIMB 1802) TaxID=880070 RepID=G0J1K7_CYCMS|nr:hypothetical protein Cycma_3689 [Cyclobacterium marinum DSM 745]|tara:strand:+ start:293 stop:406 length:114 start_codon:yes stop_codon:yes gene_type:complete